MKLLLTIAETADYVSLSESKIRRLVAQGRFPAPVGIDGNVRYRVKDLAEWSERLKVGEIPPAQTRRGRPRLAV